MKKLKHMTCYCCDAPAVSREHAPARAFFPTKEYLPEGASDLRKNLIRVPSCELHNGFKSDEDEYYACIIAMFTDGSSASSLFAKKWLNVLRDKAPMLEKIEAKIHKPVILPNGEKSLSFAFPKDDFDDYFIMMTKALYFHDFGKKIKDSKDSDSWDVYPLFVTNKNFKQHKRTQLIKLAGEKLQELSTPKEGHLFVKVNGENKDVFWYQKIDTGKNLYYRYMFYGVSEIIVTYKHSETTSIIQS